MFANSFPFVPISCNPSSEEQDANKAQKHKKNAHRLEITKVKGIGDKKAAKLITEYKTKEALKKATVEELAKTAGVNIDTARELKEIIDEM